MGILIATKLSSKWQNFAFLFWKYFEQIFDSNVIIIINLYNFGGNKLDMNEYIWKEAERMFEMKKKRVRLTMEEKLWLVSHHEKNHKITQAKIGLDFLAKSICWGFIPFMLGLFLIFFSDFSAKNLSTKYGLSTKCGSTKCGVDSNP